MVDSGARDVLDTSRPHAARRWDDLLTLQVDLFLPRELSALRESDAWRRAGSVLDVGCGNGRFVSRLAEEFPGMDFVGIDRSDELIRAANHGPTRAGLRFECRDFLAEDLDSQFDVVLFRFVVQYLSDFAAVLDRTDRHVRPGGAVIIIEPALRESRLYPDCPRFTDMLTAFEAQQGAAGRLRARLDEMPAVAASRNWRVRNTVVDIPVFGPVNGEAATRLFSHWLDLCEHASGLRHDFAKTRSELADWARSPAAFAKIALRMMELVREPPASREMR